jgi:hypothetical protein
MPFPFDLLSLKNAYFHRKAVTGNARKHDVFLRSY